MCCLTDSRGVQSMHSLFSHQTIQQVWAKQTSMNHPRKGMIIDGSRCCDGRQSSRHVDTLYRMHTFMLHCIVTRSYNGRWA